MVNVAATLKKPLMRTASLAKVINVNFTRQEICLTKQSQHCCFQAFQSHQKHSSLATKGGFKKKKKSVIIGFHERFTPFNSLMMMLIIKHFDAFHAFLSFYSFLKRF